MKPLTFLTLVAFLPLLTSACAHEISHTESDHTNWFGKHTKEQTTVYQNPDGSTSTTHDKQSSSP